METLPKNTASIFEYLQKGLFVNANSVDENIRKMFITLEEHYDTFYEYFIQINYILEHGNEYYYFSRVEPKASLEQKIMKAYFWIDVIDFFKAYDETFGPGKRFSPEHILVEAGMNTLVKSKLDSFKKHFSSKETWKDLLDSIIYRLTRESFLELENDKMNTYKVMNAWNYLERFIESINIIDETEDEKPQ